MEDAAEGSTADGGTRAQRACFFHRASVLWTDLQRGVSGLQLEDGSTYEVSPFAAHAVPSLAYPSLPRAHLAYATPVGV